MGIAQTLIVYLLIGTTVGAAIWVACNDDVGHRTLPELVSWIVFWPFFAPAVLGQAVSGMRGAPDAAAPPSSDVRLHEAQERLVRAIRSVDGLAQGALRPHLAQIDMMMRSLDQAQVRCGEMDELLRSREFNMGEVEEALQALRGRGYDDDEPRVRSLLARRRNIERLRTMRDHTRDEIERALLRLEEMGSQVMLLRFAEQKETRLASLLKEVAGNVEDLAKAVLEMNDLC